MDLEDLIEEWEQKIKDGNTTISRESMVEELREVTGIEPKPQGIYEFTYCLHDQNAYYERISIIENSLGFELPNSVAGPFGQQFSDVALKCTIDVGTGEVTIVGLA